MELKLSVVSYHRFTSDFEAKKTFVFDGNKNTYTIGRSDLCDWYLPDPERVISSCHSELEYVDDDIYIIDQSTNGVFINHSLKPLGKENNYKINVGDIVSMGDYEVEVSDIFLEDKKPKAKISDCKSVDEILKEDSDDISFGIPISSFNRTSEGNTPIVTNSHDFKSALPVFSGSIEDSFIAPENLNVKSNHSDTDSVPEDWSSYLNIDDHQNEDKDSPELPITTPSIEQEQPIKQHICNMSLNEESEAIERTSSDDLEAFIKGLGISSGMVPLKTDHQWWYELGCAMNYLMSGVMDTLHQRSEFKQNYRLNHTLFKRQENNPLKFSANVEDAVHNLFNRNTTSFLSAEQAIKEAFIDIEKHEKALLAGVEGSVSGIMKLLSPCSIKNRTPEKQFWHRISTSKSNWATYEALYQRLNEELCGGGKAFYWEDFVKAYEASLRDLNQEEV
ncbi:type VI secretion system-associated FHA domain protein TagH [Photobacterium sp. J15]|uniref:type VI secretion system-associated FHA domain protein TagH n=1 Tax=Photobacterium sp. J15 TaxID=265901 RepID=UPI0007E4B539|nr:type VI secretion system-associated FHA domain protein TagH [Photobacterium sp. J15]